MLDWLNSQLYREWKLYSSTLLFFPTITSHIEITPLADGTYEFIQEPDGDIFEAQANVLALTEVPNSDSEEPKSTDSLDTITGKPRMHNPIISNYAIYYYLIVHLSDWSWTKTLDA